MRGLIFSAGLGERLRPLTSARAKPAVEFLNMPMLAFPYHWLNTLGLEELVLNTHYLPESVRHAAMQVVDPAIALHFTHEPAILGSGGGIWNARFHLKDEENFATANGDGVILCARPDLLRRMHEFHVKKNALATLLVCPLEGVGEKLPGVWTNSSGEVSHFGKEARPGLHCLHYGSYMLLNRRIWPHLPEGSSNILYDILQPLIAQGEKVYGFRADDMQWFETGNASDYLAATRQCLEHLRDPQSAFGRTLLEILDEHSPAFREQSRFADLRLIADTADIDSTATLSGFQVIGPDAQVGAGATLENCVILPGAKVHDGQSAKNQILI